MFTSTYVIEDLVRLHQRDLLADAEAARLAGLARRHNKNRGARRRVDHDRAEGVSHPAATLATCEPRVAA